MSKPRRPDIGSQPSPEQIPNQPTRLVLSGDLKNIWIWDELLRRWTHFHLVASS